MSAFAVVFERSDISVNRDVLKRATSRLQHHGPDGYNDCLCGPVAMAHWHFWTTPEELGEKQPLEAGALRLVFDGRLDNRAELLSRLGVMEQDSCLSDAGLVLQSYAKWGEGCVENFLGEFALVIWDRSRGQLFCARDPLGERTLFYAFYGTSMVVASECWAVAGADGSQPALNEAAVAHYFAMKATQDGQTVFKSVTEMLPAHAMIVTAAGERRWCYWQPEPFTRFVARSDEEYAECFVALLQASVRCRLRSTTPVAILMSGGLDSTSVACLAARMLSPQALKTISYVFDELVDCDERQYIDAVRQQWGLDSIQMPCDDAWRLMDLDGWPHNPNEHEGNPFRLLKERSYRRAQQEGIRVLLTGSFGDELYLAGRDWLFEAIRDRRAFQVGRELVAHLRRFGLQSTVASVFWARTARRSFDAVPGGSRLHRKRSVPAWQTPFTEAVLTNDPPDADPALHLKAALVSLTTAHSETLEIFNASRYSLNLRRPYRDRRLVEFALSLPAYQLYSQGFYKYILRVAMKGILPDSVRLRPRQTSLAPLFSRGLEREQASLGTYLLESDAPWKRFVRADWLSQRLKTGLNQPGPGLMIPWLCVSYQKWHNLIMQ